MLLFFVLFFDFLTFASANTQWVNFHNVRLKLKLSTHCATGESIYRIQHTSRFIINDILKATHLALTSTNCCYYYSFVLSTELFYTVQVIKFLHVNRQVKVFCRLAVVFSCSCLSLISRSFMFTFFSYRVSYYILLQLLTEIRGVWKSRNPEPETETEPEPEPKK